MSISELFIIVLFIVLFVVLTTIYGYLRGFNRSDKLLRLVTSRDSICILMHENPDPDAMASAMGLKRLFENYDLDISIKYSGEIHHHQNRAFKAILNVSFDKISSAEEINSDVVLVDHNEIRGVENGDKIDPVAVVDHHGTQRYDENTSFYPDFSTDSIYTHIEPSVGSCSTLVTEYLLEQGFSPKKKGEKSLSENMSTALFVGLMTDTKELTRGVNEERDFKISMKIYPGINQDKFYRIMNPKVDESLLNTKAKAIMNLQITGTACISDVGVIKNIDSIPEAAEEVVRHEKINSVIVLGEINNEIRMSGRSYDDRVHMGEVIKEVTEKYEKGSGGGHATMGGGTIPTESIEDLEQVKEDLISLMNGNIDH